MKKFELTADHLTLLQNMYVEWWDAETGAPGIDPKRPYGNSNVEADIAFMLGWVKSRYEEEETDEIRELYNKAMKLHEETETALQICLLTGKFEPGTYERTVEWNRRSWKKVS